MTGCGRCHTCGAELESLPKLLKLPAERDTYNWCTPCNTWRFYEAHGHGLAITEDDAIPCPKEAT